MTAQSTPVARRLILAAFLVAAAPAHAAEPSAGDVPAHSLTIGRPNSAGANPPPFYGIHVLPYGPSMATIFDESSAPTLLIDKGARATGWDASAATYSGSFILGPGGAFAVGSAGAVTAASVTATGALSIGGMATIGASVNTAADMPLIIRNAYGGNTLGKTATLLFQLADTVGAIKPAGNIQIVPADVNVIGAAMQFSLRQGDAMGSAVAQLDGTGRLNVVGRFSAPLHTPASSSEACAVGDAFDDASFHYVCTATNHIRRVALGDF